MIYLDTSALASFLLGDANGPLVRDFVAREAPTLAVGDLAAAEFAAVVSREVRTGGFDEAGGRDVLRTFDAWLAASAEALPTDPADLRVAVHFVRRFDLALRAPDALHIAVCHRLGVPLLTFDARQAAAARALGVAVVPLGPAAGDA